MTCCQTVLAFQQHRLACNSRARFTGCSWECSRGIAKSVLGSTVLGSTTKIACSIIQSSAQAVTLDGSTDILFIIAGVSSNMKVAGIIEQI